MTTIDNFSSYYEGKSVREMIEDTRRWLGVNATDTTRYADTDVVRALNMGQERFAKLTGCLSLPVVVTLKASRQNYRLPYGCLGIKEARYYYGTAATAYWPLQIVNEPRKLQRLNAQMRGQTGTPDYLFPSYRFGNVLSFGLTPIPSADGDTWVADDYGVLVSATGYTVTGKITGTHKVGYDDSAFLVDSAGRDLTTYGAQIGYPIFNTTDNSYGLITAIGDQDATNDKISVTLAGGSENDWDAADAFEIPMQEYGVVLDVGMDEVYTISSYFGTIADIAGGSGNLVLDCKRAPIAMSADSPLDDFICEIPSSYHEAPIAYAVYWLGRGAFKGVTQREKAAEAMLIFNNYVMEFDRPDELADESNREIEDRWYEWLG